MKTFIAFIASSLCCVAALRADYKQPPPNPQAAALDNYFDRQVSQLEGQLEREIKTKEDWLARKDQYRKELGEMLGLEPLPARSDLHATITGQHEIDGVIVENIQFQAMPHLYVTGNLYRPVHADKPLPTILYVCGHSLEVKNGISYGNKVHYQHHGFWYAQHGFVCLTIDTVELGEIRGEHHGTFKDNRWWWFSRSYTPAGEECWAGMRGVDYLVTRPEVDTARIAVTGRSGGGAYSWFIAAMDDRIAVCVPTAGITTLRNYVVDSCVEGHCDCMFFVNTYRWDYEKLAALVAPRPLCIANTDKDVIFPFDGVTNIYRNVRRIYKLLGAEKNIGIQLAEGPHGDTQPLNTGEFHWMTRFLQGKSSMESFSTATTKPATMEQLKVFAELPKDEICTTIDQKFVPQAPIQSPAAVNWPEQRDQWMKELREKSFRGWTSGDGCVVKDAVRAEHDGIVMTVRDVVVDQDFPLRLYLAHRASLKPSELELVVLNVLDDVDWNEFANTYATQFGELFPNMKIAPDAKNYADEAKMYGNFKWGMAYVCPRGIGSTDWRIHPDSTDKKALAKTQMFHTQKLRRFYLIGQTLDGQQVYDIRQAIHALRGIDGLGKTNLWLQSSRDEAGNSLYASLFEDHITRLDLHALPHSHNGGPTYLNVLRYLDMPQALAMAAERTRVVVYDDDKAAWDYAVQIDKRLGWGKATHNGLQLRDVPKDEANK